MVTILQGKSDPKIVSCSSSVSEEGRGGMFRATWVVGLVTEMCSEVCIGLAQGQ